MRSYRHSFLINNSLFKLNILLLGIFCFARIYRNSFAYESEQQGGIWNVIALFYIFEAFILVNKKKIRTPFVIASAFYFSFLTMLHSLFFLKTVSSTELYYVLMVSFYACVLYDFYYCSRCVLNRWDKILTYIIFLAIAIVAFLSMQGFREASFEFVMVSSAYYPLCLLPFIIQIDYNKYLKIFAYLLVAVIIALSLKRTGTIALIGFIICAMFNKYFSSRNIKTLTSGAIALSIIAILLFLAYSRLADEYDLTLFERINNLSEDGGSSRDKIYATLISSYLNSNLLEMLFGHGLGSVGTVLPKGYTAAHDDFLQILFESGLLPCLIFILHYYALFRTTISMISCRYEYSGIMLGSFFIGLLMSLFSTYCVSFSYVLCGAAFLGYALSQYNMSKVKSYKIASRLHQ